MEAIKNHSHFSALRGTAGGIVLPCPVHHNILTMMFIFNGRLFRQVVLLSSLLLAGTGCSLLNDSENEFEPLFDGHSLKGWVLNNPRGDGYGVTNVVTEGVTNAVIFCAKGGGGNLLTEKEYGDFVLRFEFRLTPNANNGLAIRAPVSGDAAYNGLELQILDGTSGKYTNLKPYQTHGSIYGVAPAKRGFLKPVGKWNHQKVTVKGPLVVVELNGTKITEANLDELEKKNPKHKGVKRRSGHICFCGHGSPVQLRNITIVELPDKSG